MTDRNGNQTIKEEYQKWDYITLTDFRTASLGKVFSYGWVWFLALVSVAVYSADTYTAVNLLIFGRWTSQIQPAIPVTISRWIFAGCILLSFVLCIYSWIRAVSITRRNNVAECYLDPLTVTLQSLRVTKKGQGWRRFLVFAALTKSKKGADYIALFVHFQFKGAFRLLLAEGPRQVINGMTLYSVMRAQLLPTGQNAGNPFVQFIKNIQVLVKTETEQATILFTMLFTFVIWAVSFLSFLAACAAWVSFLWYYIPREDRTLSKYCRRKVEKRLARIVNDKAKQAMQNEEAQKRGDEEKGLAKPGQAFDPLSRRPTLATMADADSDYQSTVLKGADPLSRSDSTSWRPPQSSNSFKSFASDQPLLRQPTLPSVGPDSASKPLPDINQSQRPNSDDSRKPTLPQVDIDPPASGRPAGPFRAPTQSSGLSNFSNKSSDPFLPQTVDRGLTESPKPLEEDTPGRQPSRQNTFGRQPPPGSRLASSTPYPDDNSVMGRENTLGQRAQPGPFGAAPPNRPLPAYPNQQKRLPTNPPPNTWQQPPPADIEMQPQQPPPSLRVGPPQPQTSRSPSPPPAAAQWPLKPQQQDSSQGDDPSRPPPNPATSRGYSPPMPMRSATTDPYSADPYSGGPRPPRSGTAPPTRSSSGGVGMRNDGYGPPRSRTAQFSDPPRMRPGPGFGPGPGPGGMMRPPPQSSSFGPGGPPPPRRGPGPGSGPGFGPPPRSRPGPGFGPGPGPGPGQGPRPGPGPNRGGGGPYGGGQGPPNYGGYQNNEYGSAY